MAKSVKDRSGFGALGLPLIRSRSLVSAREALVLTVRRDSFTWLQGVDLIRWNIKMGWGRLGYKTLEKIKKRESNEKRGSATWMSSCTWAIYFTAGKFPGDKSSGNDKLHCTANSSYLFSNSCLQPSFHLTMCLTSTALNKNESRGHRFLFSWQRSQACHPVLLPGKETDGRPKTLKKPLNTAALMRPWKPAALVFGCFPLSSSWPSGKIG